IPHGAHRLLRRGTMGSRNGGRVRSERSQNHESQHVGRLTGGEYLAKKQPGGEQVGQTVALMLELDTHASRSRPIAPPGRSDAEPTSRVIAKKIIPGRGGTRWMPTTEMRSRMASASSSSQHRNPTRKLFSGCSNMACPTWRTRSGHKRKVRRPIR